MSEKFVVGDVVKLKSGGPEMTVNSYLGRLDKYSCQWFAGKKLEQGSFPEDSLEKVEKDKS
ncbi:YodC family protein [Billgrantia gudaonensis]|uniref:YodC family protein n=1 Tax=Billgrantia gudaonensis TaxID=376427 RepID=UPI000B7FD9F7|nr:YodC family protein [Halomonas gudaonensis]